MMAEKMMEEKLYDFCGSDVHHLRHIQNMDKLIRDNQPVMKKMVQYGFKNNTLISS
jgi:tyrosine-protein phosphatase YwqE